MSLKSRLFCVLSIIYILVMLTAIAAGIFLFNQAAAFLGMIMFTLICLGYIVWGIVSMCW